MDEISISTKDNPANGIIRNVIANKDKNTDKFAQYSANFYSRGLYRIKDAPEKFLGRNRSFNACEENLRKHLTLERILESLPLTGEDFLLLMEGTPTLIRAL